MSKTIVVGGILLNPHMKRDKQYSSSGMAHQTLKYTVTGRGVLFPRPRTGLLPITLIADQESGWLTEAQVAAIYELSIDYTAVFEVVIGNEAHPSCMFRHYDEPAFEADPLIEGALAPAGGLYTATIKLVALL